MRNFHILLLLTGLFALQACNEAGTAKFEQLSANSKDKSVPGPPATSPYSEIIDFQGITSIDSSHPTKAIINWTDTENVLLYKVYEIDAGSEALLAELAAPADNYKVEGLIEGKTYKYKVIAYDSEEKPAEVQTEVELTTAECPSNYLKVAGNSLQGTNDFCVMKYEAKDVDGIATSQPELTPWVSISRINAYAECDELNSFHGVSQKYELISNAEWMTIAYELEDNPLNWSGGSVASGFINRGRISGSRSPVDDTEDPYSNTGQNGVWDYKRTHTLSSGEEIWDLAGNVWEAVDWEIGGGLEDGPSGCGANFVAINTANCGGLSAIEFKSQDPSLNNAHKIGHFFGDGSPRAFRGGSYNYGSNSGIYALGFAYSSTWSATYVGFRCVYRP